MIEVITPLQKDQPTIRLLNPHGKDIYRLNSINLIIGDNGSGKTRLIKWIIRDLCNESAAASFSFDGITENLGVIYYTAAPFHQTIPSKKTANISFIDTSQVARIQQRFSQTAKEYVEVRDLLDLETPVGSIVNFSFEYIAQRLLTNIRKVIFKDFGSPEIYELHSKYRGLIGESSKISRHRNEIIKSQHELRNSSQESIKELHDDNLISKMLSDLKSQEEKIILERIQARKNLVKQFLIDCRPTSKKRAVMWLAAWSLIGSNPNSAIIKNNEQILKVLYLKDPELDPLFKKTWLELIDITTNFVNTVCRDAGEFIYDRNEIKFSVDLPAFVKAKIPENLVEAAHKRKLVNIGFHTLSSGEAAITHQLASISQGIHDLALEGKERFIIFIDEGDLLLHLSWQRKYLDLIDFRLSSIRENLKLKSMQVIVASHSPLLTSDILRDSITRLGKKPGYADKPTGFGAPLQQIVNYSFGTSAIGAIAERTINRIKALRSLNSAQKDIVDQIDDDYIRSVLGSK